MVATREALLRAVGYGSGTAPFAEVGIGLDVGEAFVGNIGQRALYDFTAVGDVVNTASRLQGCAAGGEVVLSERVAAGLPAPPGTRVELALKGKDGPQPAYRVALGAPAVDGARRWDARRPGRSPKEETMDQPTPHRTLVVANRTASTPVLLQEVERRAHERPTSFALLIPDVESRHHADWTLERALALLERAAHAPVEGLVGGADPFESIRDVIAEDRFDDVLISRCRAGARSGCGATCPTGSSASACPSSSSPRTRATTRRARPSAARPRVDCP